jgi:hypothetical protein
VTSSWNPIAPQILHKELDKVHATLDLATKAKQDSSEFAKNGLDPFIATIAAGAAGSWETWEIAERTRQIQKALENEIGAFHQRHCLELTDNPTSFAHQESFLLS